MSQGSYLGLGGGGGEGPGRTQLYQQRLHVGGQVPAVPHQLTARHHHIDLCNNHSSLFAYYFLKLHLHHFSKIKSQTEVAKQEESKFFLLFLLDNGRIRSQIRTLF
jgi:hypothetical protein